MSTALDVLVALACLPVALWVGYLFTLTLLSAPNPVPPPATGTPVFDVVVPAHDEEAGIGRTVSSLLALDWPAEHVRVLVVADNCSDGTAAAARAAGATVLERFDTERRGKGYALAHAFAHSKASGATAVVVIDADTQVSKNLLKAFAARLAGGAHAVQAHYGVANPFASWRTTLMAIALGMFHKVRSRGRERLGTSCGLRGNGMCFTHAVLQQVPHDAFSIVEDLEYGIRLGRAGFRVTYAGEAHVEGDMVSGEKASRSQRVRWESGRAALRKEHLGPLLRDGLRTRSLLLLDLAFDVLVPPLSYVGLGTVFALGVGLLLRGLGAPGVTLGVGLALSVGLGLHVLRGWSLSGTGPRGLGALVLAPGYVAWKVALMAGRKGSKPKEWVRTTRE